MTLHAPQAHSRPGTAADVAVLSSGTYLGRDFKNLSPLAMASVASPVCGMDDAMSSGC